MESENGAKDPEGFSSQSFGSYSSNIGEDDYDNMCDFDPASEDDMDDNGMSRYMENYDDKGGTDIVFQSVFTPTPNLIS